MIATEQKLTDAIKRQGINPPPQIKPDMSGHSGRLVTIPLSDVEAKEIQWLWPNRFPAGMLSLLVGNPGVGKSFLTMYMCSRITTGKDWPDSDNNIEPGSVLLFSDEESLEYAIKPRLESHGADCSKVFAVEHIKRSDGFPDTFSIDEHMTGLRLYLDTLPDCRLMIFDPITAYLGAVNANSNAEVRGALAGLQNLAQERNITVLGINHFSKKSDIDAIYRTLGSTAFVAAARSAWAVVLEKQDEECEDEPGRLFLPIKSNYSINPSGLRYEIIDGEVVFDDGENRVDIDAIMQKAKTTGGMKASKKEAIVSWLKETIGSEPVLADDLQDEASEKGFSWRYVQRVANDEGVIKEKSGQHNGKYVWKWHNVQHAP